MSLYDPVLPAEVRDTDGNVLIGATVSLYTLGTTITSVSVPLYEFTTDSNGNWDWSDVPPAVYEMQISGSSIPESIEYTLLLDKSVDTGSLTVVAGDTITITNRILKLTAAAPTTMTSVPTIAAGQPNQFADLVGTSDTNYIVIQDKANLVGSLLDLGGVNFTLKANDVLPLYYNSTLGFWTKRI